MLRQIKYEMYKTRAYAWGVQSEIALYAIGGA